LGTEGGALPQLRETSLAGRVVAFCRTHRLLVLFVVAFAVRVAFILAFGPTAPPWDLGDDHAYDLLAYRLVTQHEYANTLYTPGYPLFLALNYMVFGRSWFLARLVQAGLGAGTCLLIYRLGTKVFSDREGLFAGFLLAIYPGHVFFSWRLMAEPLYILLLTWSLLLALALAEDPQPLRAFALGALVAVNQLVKGNLCFFPAMLVVWFAFSACGRAKRRALCVATLITGLALALLIQPIANFLSPARQAQLLPSNAGYTLWVGNNPQSAGYNDADVNVPAVHAFIESHGFAERLKTADMADDMVERERIYHSLVLSWIRENPGRFLALMPKKLNNAFGLFPRARVFEGDSLARRIVHLLTYGPVALFALGGMIAAIRRWRACSLLYVVVASYVPTVLLFYGTPRWTLLITPELLIFASFAIVGLYTYITGSNRMPRLGGTPGQPS
jgi:4-amino-4-deoxy-L-arabinose transferase-like glycosyltransferase